MYVEPIATGAILAAMLTNPAEAPYDLWHAVEERPHSIGGTFDTTLPTIRLSSQEARGHFARLEHFSPSSASFGTFSISDASDAAKLEDSASQIAELRRLSGLTWVQISEFFGVSKRTPYLWASGSRVAPANHQRLGELVALMRYMDRGSSEENLNLLVGTARDGKTFLDLLIASDDDNFRELVGQGHGRTELPAKLSLDAKNFNGSEHWGQAAFDMTADVVEVPIAKSNLRKLKPPRNKV